MGDTFDGVVETISGGMTDIIDSISGGVSGVLDSVAGIFESMGGAALDAGTGFEKLANAVINLVSNTGVLDLGATLGAVSAGVDKINTSASGADAAAAKVALLTAAFTALTVAALASTKQVTSFGTTTKATMATASNSIRYANLAGSMSAAVNGAYYAAAGGLASLRSLFANTGFSFNQHIAVPHFSMNGQFDAQAGTVPVIRTAWYARAAEVGAIFTEPKIIGVGDASQPELLIGLDTLREEIGSGMTVTNYITVNGAEDPEAWASQFARRLQMMARTGGA